MKKQQKIKLQTGLFSEKTQVYNLLLMKARLKAREDFYAFVQLMAPVVLPDKFKDGKHIKLICDRLHAVERGDSLRLMLALPPGAMKSVLVNKLFTAWCLGRHPQWHILSVSHSDRLAEAFGRDVRDLISGEEYKEIFPHTTIRPDVRAASRWHTDSKGVYMAVGGGAAIAGFRANLAIMDDVISEQTAKSDVELARIIDWYPGGFRSRLLPGARVVSVATRWRHDDLQGWLLDTAKNNAEADQWELIKIPAILDHTAGKLLGLPEGESFWPELWSKENFLTTKANTAASVWSALYMQEPSPETGALFKRDWFQWWPFEYPPECEYVLMSMDTAYSKGRQASYSVVQTWGIFRKNTIDSKGRERSVPNMLLLAQTRGRFEYPELRLKTQQIFDKYKPDAILVEKKASGQSLLQDLRRIGLPMREFLPDRDKISRANAVTPILESLRVFVPKRLWADDLISEALQFPVGANDDCVDAMTQAILFMRENFLVGSPEEDFHPEDVRAIRKPKTYWSNRGENRAN